MAKGKTHDTINIFALFLLILPLLSSIVKDLILLSVFTISYIFGTLFLSPDLDLKNTLPYKRWGKFSFIWLIYSKIIPHRSWLSHGFLIGTIFRILWLIVNIFLIGFIFVWLLHLTIMGDAVTAYLKTWNEIKWFCIDNKNIIIFSFTGVMLSSLLHEMVDSLWSFIFKRR